MTLPPSAARWSLVKELFLELRELPDPASGDLNEALNDFAWSLDAREDLHATPRYRRELVRRLGRDAIEEALRCRS